MFVKKTLILSAVFGLAVGCGGGDDDGPSWERVLEEQPSALLAVWGTSASDVWVVGGRPVEGNANAGSPLALHYDGSAWESVDAGADFDLWWVFGFEGGPVFMSGNNGTIVKYENGTAETMTTPGTGVIFGMWGTSPSDLWAVGGRFGGGGGGFAWHYDGTAWSEVDGVPTDEATMFKVAGRASDDVWIVGESGVTLHWDGSTLERFDAPNTDSYFSVSCDPSMCTAVGGFLSGSIMENDGSGWQSVNIESEVVRGVWSTPSRTYAVGNTGLLVERSGSEWVVEENPVTNLSLHANWIDPDGGVWAVGGTFDELPLRKGVLIYQGEADIAGL